MAAATSPDIEAEAMAVTVESTVDMALIGVRVAPLADIEELLGSIPRDPPRVRLLVGPDRATKFAERRFAGETGLVIIRVSVPFGHIVRTGPSVFGW